MARQGAGAFGSRPQERYVYSIIFNFVLQKQLKHIQKGIKKHSDTTNSNENTLKHCFQNEIKTHSNV